MADTRYVLHHEVLGAGKADTGWSKEFPTLEEARRTADQDWWTADARAVRQTIISSNGDQQVRRADGTWTAIPRKGRFRR